MESGALILASVGVPGSPPRHKDVIEQKQFGEPVHPHICWIVGLTKSLRKSTQKTRDSIQTTVLATERSESQHFPDPPFFA